MRVREFRFVAAVTVALFAAACLACSHAETSEATGSGSSASPRKNEITVSPAQQAEWMIATERVSATDEPELLRVSGHIALPDTRTWHVGVRTNGLASTVAVGVGDAVRKGDVLARYHADELRDARAKYRQALADLQRARAGELLAQRNADRAETLLGLKAASQQQVEQARQDAVVASAMTRASEIELERIRHVLEHDLQVAADADPDDPIADEVPIIAPASGYVLERNISPGRAVHTEDDAFVIGDASQVWMLAAVRQEQLGLLRLGQHARIALPGVLAGPVTGTITNLGQQLDPVTRAMQVRILVNNPGNRLRPEMLATAEIPVGEPRPRLRVASDAIQRIDDDDIVFVRIAPDRFAVRVVRVDQTSSREVPVLDGLKSGEEVVVTGSFLLKSQLLRAAIEE